MLSAQSINAATNRNDDNQMTIFGHKPAVQYTSHGGSCGNCNGENRPTPALQGEQRTAVESKYCFPLFRRRWQSTVPTLSTG